MSTPGAIWNSIRRAESGRPDRPERDDGEADHRRDDRDHRRQDVERLGDVARDHVFLEDILAPSASGWSRPNGMPNSRPARFGPIRSCA